MTGGAERRAVLDHFEIPVADGAGLAAFLEEVFGWSAETPRRALGGEYRRLESAPAAAPTRVGLWQGAGEVLVRPTPVVRIEGEALETCLERVAAAGGRVLSAPLEVAGSGRFARFGDPEGNEWGLFEVPRAGGTTEATAKTE